MDNIETFNLVTGLVLADLYEQFPVGATLCVGEFAHEAGLCADPDNPQWDEEVFVNAVIEWLKEEGFIRIGRGTLSPVTYHQVVLSHQGLRLLSVPDSLQSQESIGQGLTKAAKDGAKQGVAALVKVALLEGGKFLVQAALQSAMQHS